MSAVVELVLSWRSLLTAVMMFSLLPGLVLRVIVLAFHRDDPTRDELLAEIHAIPWVNRSLWVAALIPAALFDGLWRRLVWAATGRVIDRWHLASGIALSRSYQRTFWIPDEAEKAGIRPGSVVKLMFEMKRGWAERMWVEVREVNGRHIVGVLDNQPIGIPRLEWSQTIKFKPEHIINVMSEQPKLA